MGLYSQFMNHQGRELVKWTHYFPAYERHLARYVNRPIVFWEIGVGNGGGLQMWRDYFGPYAQIVGLELVSHTYDHGQAYTELEEPQIAIRQGDQADTTFLSSVLVEFGIPDVVLDDASHINPKTIATFDFLYPRIARDGVYMVEDLHTAYWPWFEGGGYKHPGSFIEYVKDRIDDLHADYTEELAVDFFTKNTLSISVYDSITVFERGHHIRKESVPSGKYNGT